MPGKIEQSEPMQQEAGNDTHGLTRKELYEDCWRKLPGATGDIAKVYSDYSVEEGLNPGVIRVFVVGSLVRKGGARFGNESDIDIIFSVENPVYSLSALPRDASSRSEAEDTRQQRHDQALQRFDEIWQKT